MDRIRDMFGRERDEGAGEASTALNAAFRQWRNEIVEENAHAWASAVNQVLTHLSGIEDRINTRLDAQDAVLTTLKLELQGGRSDVNIGFETVVERQFVKERMIREMSAQLTTIATMLEQDNPSVAGTLHQAAAVLQEVVASA